MNNIEESERIMNDNVRGSQSEFANFDNFKVYQPVKDFEDMKALLFQELSKINEWTID